MKIVIGIPSGDTIYTDCAMSLLNLVQFTTTQGHQVAVVNVKSSLIQKGRTEIVQQAQQLDADALLFVDSDMIFPADALLRLLAHDKPVVGVNYARRRPPFDSTGTRERGEKFPSLGLVRAETLGFGLLLIQGEDIQDTIFKVYRWGKHWTSEDQDWCRRHEVWCDCTLSCEVRHLGVVPVGVNY